MSIPTDKAPSHPPKDDAEVDPVRSTMDKAEESVNRFARGNNTLIARKSIRQPRTAKD